MDIDIDHCKEYVIRLVNEAFNHRFPYEENISITERNTFEIAGPEGKVYLWMFFDSLNEGKRIVIMEFEPGFYKDHILPFGDAVLVRTPEVALIRFEDCRPRICKYSCIYDTVTSSVSFPMPVINAEESDTLMSAIAYVKSKYK